MAKYPSPLRKEVRAFLKEIGRIGGQTSRRKLDRWQAKEMVAIREAKKAAMKAGKMEWARKRIPLSKRKPKRPRQRSAVIERRGYGEFRIV
jgi:hypothetical protein